MRRSIIFFLHNCHTWVAGAYLPKRSAAALVITVDRLIRPCAAPPPPRKRHGNYPVTSSLPLWDAKDGQLSRLDCTLSCWTDTSPRLDHADAREHSSIRGREFHLELWQCHTPWASPVFIASPHLGHIRIHVVRGISNLISDTQQWPEGGQPPALLVSNRDAVNPLL